MEDGTRLSYWQCCTGTRRDRKNVRRYTWALAVWGLCLIAGLVLIRKELVPAGPVLWVVAALPTLAGLYVIVPFARFLRETDELHRQVQLGAMALGFGGAIFTLAGYPVLENAGAPPLDLGLFSALMIGFYGIGTYLGWRRYR